ncbi:MAG: hypothetical protein ACI4U3_04310 [Traorella sp.]
MTLTKEECLRAYEVIDTLINLMCGEKREDGYEPSIDETINSMRVLKQLIEKHFDNPPLKFEELKENMWVWDNKYKMYLKIYEAFHFKGYEEWIQYADGVCDLFEENRFFRREVKEDSKDCD